MAALITVGYFLFSLFFSSLIFVLWARIALRFFTVSSLSPVRQGIDNLTNPIVKPVAGILGKKNTLNRYDWPAFIVLVVVELIKFTLISLLFLSAMLPPIYLLLYTVADLIIQPLNLLFYAIVIRVIMSWIKPDWSHPFADILRLMTEPALRFGRRIIPDISGFDFSPFIILIILKVITLFIQALLPLPLI